MVKKRSADRIVTGAGVFSPAAQKTFHIKRGQTVKAKKYGYWGLVFSLLLLVATARVGKAADQSYDDVDRDDTVAGLYKAVLYHAGTNLYQFAKITLRTVQPGTGKLKISANVRLIYGEWDSNDFLTYDFDDCEFNWMTRQITLKDPKNDLSMIGFLRNGTLAGDWYATIVGHVGAFESAKGADVTTPPAAPKEGKLVKSLSGFYRGTLTNTNPQSNLPERVTLSFVTTQATENGVPVIKISGSSRLYLGGFETLEYVETELKDIQFNFYNRYLTAKTKEYGLTFKGYMTYEGAYSGTVLSDGLGDVAKVEVKRYPN